MNRDIHEQHIIQSATNQAFRRITDPFHRTQANSGFGFNATQELLDSLTNWIIAYFDANLTLHPAVHPPNRQFRHAFRDSLGNATPTDARYRSINTTIRVIETFIINVLRKHRAAPTLQAHVRRRRQQQQYLRQRAMVDAGNFNNLVNNLQNYAAALQAQVQRAPETQLVPIPTFRDDQDPVTWLQDFTAATDANGMDDARRLAIVSAYLKGSATNWYYTTRAQNQNQGILHWNDINNPQVSFVPLFTNHFRTHSKILTWQYELDNRHQLPGETVDKYAASFRELMRRVDPTNQLPENFQISSFLKGLRPELRFHVLPTQPATLANAIDQAKRYEASYTQNLIYGGPTLTPTSPYNLGIMTPNPTIGPTREDYDNLVRQIAELKDVAQRNTNRPRNDNQWTPRNDNYQRRPQNNSNQWRPQNYNRNNNQWRTPNNNDQYRNPARPNITCYNCQREGHIARNCPNVNGPNGNNGNLRNTNVNLGESQPLVAEQNITDLTTQLNAVISQLEQLKPSEPVMRSITKPTTKPEQTCLVNQRPEPIVVIEPRPDLEAPSKNEQVPTKETAPEKPKPSYSIVNDIRSRKADITFGQLAAVAPKLKAELGQSLRRKRQFINFGVGEKDSVRMTPLCCQASVKGKQIAVILDSGAASCAITKNLIDQLDIQINRPSNCIITGIHGEKRVPLGVIDRLPLQIGGLIIPTTVDVTEAQNYEILVGMDWLTKLKAQIDCARAIMKIHWENREVEVPVTYLKDEHTGERFADYDDDDDDNDNDEENPEDLQFEDEFAEVDYEEKPVLYLEGIGNRLIEKPATYLSNAVIRRTNFAPVNEVALEGIRTYKVSIRGAELKVDGKQRSWYEYQLLDERFSRKPGRRAKYIFDWKGPKAKCWCDKPLYSPEDECSSCLHDLRFWATIRLILPSDFTPPNELEEMRRQAEAEYQKERLEEEVKIQEAATQVVATTKQIIDTPPPEPQDTPALKYYLDNVNARAPVKAQNTNAGWDLFAPYDLTLVPGITNEVDLGIAVEIPPILTFNSPTTHPLGDEEFLY